MPICTFQVCTYGAREWNGTRPICPAVWPSLSSCAPGRQRAWGWEAGTSPPVCSWHQFDEHRCSLSLQHKDNIKRLSIHTSLLSNTVWVINISLKPEYNVVHTCISILFYRYISQACAFIPQEIRVCASIPSFHFSLLVQLARALTSYKPSWYREFTLFRFRET